MFKTSLLNYPSSVAHCKILALLYFTIWPPIFYFWKNVFIFVCLEYGGLIYFIEGSVIYTSPQIRIEGCCTWVLTTPSMPKLLRSTIMKHLNRHLRRESVEQFDWLKRFDRTHFDWSKRFFSSFSQAICFYWGLQFQIDVTIISRISSSGAKEILFSHLNDL